MLHITTALIIQQVLIRYQTIFRAEKIEYLFVLLPTYKHFVAMVNVCILFI